MIPEWLLKSPLFSLLRSTKFFTDCTALVCRFAITRQLFRIWSGGSHLRFNSAGILCLDQPPLSNPAPNSLWSSSSGLNHLCPLTSKFPSPLSSLTPPKPALPLAFTPPMPFPFQPPKIFPPPPAKLPPSNLQSYKYFIGSLLRNALTNPEEFSSVMSLSFWERNPFTLVMKFDKPVLRI